MSRQTFPFSISGFGSSIAGRCRWKIESRKSIVALALLLVLCADGARADRTILAPHGLIMSPGALQLEYAGMTTDGHTNYQWLTAGVPGKDLGLEIEGERLYSGGRSRATASLQYSFTGNAFSDIAPAISVGLRDLANEGLEGRAFYAAASKTIGLSELQEQVIRELRVHAGYGTSRMDGAFASIEMRFRPGFTICGEYLARRVNAELIVPIGSYLKVRAYSLNGTPFYGASITIRR